MQENDAQLLKSFLEELETLPVSYERHLLFEKIIVITYKYRRENANLRNVSECIGLMHFREFETLLTHIPIYVNNRIYPPISFPILSNLLTESGKYVQAIEVCEKCIAWGLDDGTKSGYLGRIERIKKLAQTNKEKPNSSCDENIQIVREELEILLGKADKYRKVPIMDIWNPEPSLHSMNKSQREFYEKWVINWKRNTPIEIEDQIAYILVYIQADLLQEISEQTIIELMKLRDQYGASYPEDLRHLRYRCGAWASDCCVLLGQIHRAIEIFPELYINHLLSLKVLLKEDLSGSEVLRLFGQVSLTEYGKEHTKYVAREIESLLSEYRSLKNASIIMNWAKQVDTQKYRLFSSSTHFREVNLTVYRFEDSPVKTDFVDQFRYLIREAENRVRKSRGIARIGEGWISETNLYYQIKQAFPDLRIEHHASPSWLGRQHLDIYLPEIRLAIEYQGRQHDEPIEFFGGERAFQETRRRDIKKRELCSQNGVTLFEIRPDDRIEKLLEEIQKMIL